MLKMNKVTKNKKPMAVVATARHRPNTKKKLCGIIPCHFAATTESLWRGALVVLVCLLISINIGSETSSSTLHPDDEVGPSTSSISIISSNSTINNDNNNKENNNKQTHSHYVAHIHNLLAANQPSLALNQVVEVQQQQNGTYYQDSIQLTMLLGISHATLNQCDQAIHAYSRALQLIAKHEKEKEKLQPSASTKPTPDDENDDSSNVNVMISSNDLKDYTIKAMTWIGVCHRRLGNAEEGLPWLEASVAKIDNHDNSGRESRHQLAHSYLAQGRYLDSAEQLAFIFQNSNAKEQQNQKNSARLEDADYYLLSIILSTLEEWELLAQSLHHCMAHACSLATTAYSAAQIYVEHAVTLEQCGRLEESLVQQQIAADLLLQQEVDSGNNINNNNFTARVREMGTAYLQSARQRGQQRAEFSTKDQEKWQSLVRILWTATAHSPTAWSIIKHRHVQGFNYPIPVKLIEQVRQELVDDQHDSTIQPNSSINKVPTFTTLPNKTAACVNHYTCLQLSIYTLEDCIFYAQVQSARLQQQLISGNGGIDIMTYSDFPRETYPKLDPTTPLHVGIYTADLRAHPMLPLIRTFLKYTSSSSSSSHYYEEELSVKVTLYHTAADPAILKEMKPYVHEMVACTREDWQSCVKHARQHKVHVWLETTGRTGDGISSIAGSGPAPVGVMWAGFPGSMGMPSTLQYMVTDRYTVPPPRDESDFNNNNTTINNNLADLYPEKMIYVPGSWMIAEPSMEDHESRSMLQNRTTTTNEELASAQERRRRREFREQYHIPNDAFVYGYFGRLWKLDDNIFTTWCSIIDRVPGSMLVLLDYHDGNADAGGAMARIRQQWSNHGGDGGRLDASRLIFLPPFDRGQHIAAQEALVDVSLDSVSYSGGATAFDAILAQRPLVHCPGGFKMTQRSAGSVLTSAGLADVLLGKDLQEYEEIAVRLGLDKVFYKQIQQRVANDSITIQNSVLFQPQIGIGAMISGMRQAFTLWRTGHAPQTIFADQHNHDPQRQLFQAQCHSEL